MKKVIAIIVFLTVSALSFGQDSGIALSTSELQKEVKVEQPVMRKASLSTQMKAKVLKINRKKSNDIISIKAYRKSLQIKVKTVKLC